MGMAWPSLSKSGNSTFMSTHTSQFVLSPSLFADSSSLTDTLTSGNDIPASQFSFSFDDGSAELFLGGANPEKYQGEFSYVNTAQDFWRVTTGGLVLNGQQLSLPQEAIIDTGTLKQVRLRRAIPDRNILRFKQELPPSTDHLPLLPTCTARFPARRTCLKSTGVFTLI